jgi:peroxin-19
LTPEFDDLLSQQFAKELAKGMEDMFGAGAGATAASGGSGAGTAAGTAGGQPEMSEEEMMKQFEKIMQEMGLGDEGMAALGGGAAGGAAPPAGTRGAAGGSAPLGSGDPANFQDAIKSTMSRLRQSQGSSGAGSSSKAGGADPFADFSDEDMAKLLQGLGGEGGLPEGEEGMAGMLEKMMGELMSKEVLYEPLKELRDKVSRSTREGREAERFTDHDHLPSVCYTPPFSTRRTLPLLPHHLPRRKMTCNAITTNTIAYQRW